MSVYRDINNWVPNEEQRRTEEGFRKVIKTWCKNNELQTYMPTDKVTTVKNVIYTDKNDTAYQEAKHWNSRVPHLMKELNLELKTDSDGTAYLIDADVTDMVNGYLTRFSGWKVTQWKVEIVEVLKDQNDIVDFDRVKGAIDAQTFELKKDKLMFLDTIEWEKNNKRESTEHVWKPYALR